MPPIPVTETGRQIKALTKLRKARIASYSQITVPQIIRLEKGFRVILKLSRFIFNSTGLFFYSAWRISWRRHCSTGAPTSKNFKNCAGEL